MEMKGKGAGSQGYPPRGLGQRPNSTHARESARPPGNPKSLQNLRSLQIPAHSHKYKQEGQTASRQFAPYEPPGMGLDYEWRNLPSTPKPMRPVPIRNMLRGSGALLPPPQPGLPTAQPATLSPAVVLNENTTPLIVE